MANLPLFLMMVLYPASILSIFGRSFVGGATAMSILAIGELVNAGTGICGSIIDMTGYTKLKLANSVIWAVLISGSNILLIPEWGVVGAATAAVVSISTVNILRVLQVWILFRLQPYNMTFVKPTVAGIVASATVLLLGQWLPAGGNIFIAGIHIVVLFIVYGGVVLLLGLEPEERVVLSRLYRRANAARSKAQLTVHKYLTARLGAR
jgi:O-antigen/teichoic acid export membrane protein